MELTVLGCSGSYGSPLAGGACSGYLVRDGATAIWVDCGNGSFVNLQRLIDPAELSAVVVTHEHPDHCVDLYGLHVHHRYALDRRGLPVYAPAGADARLGVLAHFQETFAWHACEDGPATVGSLSLAFSRTDHPVPTFAVEVTDGGGRRLVYTSDTGPGWSPEAFPAGAGVVLADSSYLHADRRSPIHLSARQAGEGARAAGAEMLVLTHFWPGIDPDAAGAEGSEAFGRPAIVAAVDTVVTV
jgi:ribonuclease BN (tRNA processing enzyme)